MWRIGWINLHQSRDTEGMRRLAALTIVCLIAPASLCAQQPASETARGARAWRVQHELDIYAELTSLLLAIPNIASDGPNIERNAGAIVEMFARRKIEARSLRIAGAPPLIVADVKAPGARARNPNGWRPFDSGLLRAFAASRERWTALSFLPIGLKPVHTCSFV